MNRYLVFAGTHYYPDGGAGDYWGSATTIKKALEIKDEYNCDWWHVFDNKTEKIIRANKGSGWF